MEDADANQPHLEPTESEVLQALSVEDRTVLLFKMVESIGSQLKELVGRSTPMKHFPLESPRSKDSERDEVLLNTRLFDRRGSKRDSQEVGGELPDSDSSSISSSESSGSEENKRASMLKPSSSKKSMSRTVVSVYQDQPSYSHISLKYLGINEVFKFWTEINKYQEMHGIALKPTTLISDDCRRRIMSRCDIASEVKFFALSQNRLRKYIQKAVRPTDKNMFTRMLASSLKFWESKDNFVLSIATFQTFYDRLLTYRQEFKDKFDFLAYHNETNIPKLENKEGGTIKTFLSALPQEYAARTFSQLPKSRFDDLNEFLSAFYKLAKQHYVIAVDSKKLNSFIPNASAKSGSSSHTVPRRDDYKPRFVPKINNVEEVSLEDDYFDEASFRKFTENEEKQEELSPEAATTEDPSSLNAFGGGMLRMPLRTPPKPPGEKKPATALRGPNGCFRALTEGKCSKPNCSFDHTIPVLDATLDELLSKLNKKLYRARPLNAIWVPDEPLDGPGEIQA